LRDRFLMVNTIVMIRLRKTNRSPADLQFRKVSPQRVFVIEDLTGNLLKLTCVKSTKRKFCMYCDQIIPSEISMFGLNLELKPQNYYATPCTAYSIETDNVWRVRRNSNDVTIYNDPDTDPMLKVALSHRIVMENVSSLIEDADRKYISYLSHAIIRGDIIMLAQVLCAIAEAVPIKMTAYVQTLQNCLTDLISGISFSVHDDPKLILLHLYQSSCAIAVQPGDKSVAVLPIYTDWDGTVLIVDGEVISPTVEGLMQQIQQQAICRILLQYESDRGKNSKMDLPVVRELAA
jgi:hypothetical protein